MAAFALWRVVRGGVGRPAAPVSVAVLPVLLTAIGLCSLAFHTLATSWTAALDSLSIAVFVHYYLVCVAHWFGGIRWRWAWLAAPGFAAFVLLVTALVGGGATACYLPALLALWGLVIGLWIAGVGGYARRFAVAGVVFACSLVLRALDQPLCLTFPVGTRFLWHVLNAVVLYLAGRVLVMRWAAGVDSAADPLKHSSAAAK